MRYAKNDFENNRFFHIRELRRKTNTVRILPITVVICTLNEGKNIEECLTSVFANNPAEILVIDADSDDNTAEIARNTGAKLKKCERRGLAYQRYKGIELASQPYIAYVDADDVLDSECLSKLLEDMEKNNYTAVQSISRSYSLSTYWERAMDSLDCLRSAKPGKSKMVGRPALYRKDILSEIGIDKNWGRIGNEDTDLSIRYDLNNCKMGIGTGSSRRKHERTLKDWLKKWEKYGKGDLKIIQKYPDKKKSILFHQIIDYPILLSWQAIRKGYSRYCPFYILFGITRFYFMTREMIRQR